MGPPKGLISEMSPYIPGLDQQIPGTGEVSELAEDLAGVSDLVDKGPWSGGQISVVPNVGSNPTQEPAYPMGFITDDDGPRLPARRLSVRQVE